VGECAGVQSGTGDSTAYEGIRQPFEMSDAIWKAVRWTARTTRRRTRFAWDTTERTCLSLGLIALAGGAAFTLALGPPPAHSGDEFSYLLAADTFAAGRMTNPTHPMWQHFESFHILQTPTYASKYPPAQGLFLAVGQVLSGAPIVGAWLSLALAGAGIGWMLRAWFSPGWSFLGGLLLVLRPQVAYWGDCYFGGSVPLLGGALVLGAVPRLCRQNRARDGLALASGLLLLANSRPFEGLLLCLVPLGTLLVHRLWSRRDRLGLAPWRVLLPSLALLACGGGFMAGYNWSVTGDPLSLPYRLYEEQYSYVPLFTWGEMGTPLEYRHEAFRRFYTEWVEWSFNLFALSPSSWRVKLLLLKQSVMQPFLGWALLIPLVVALLRPRALWLPLVAGSAVLAGNLVTAWIWPHYFSPALGALFILVTWGLRRLMTTRFRGRPLGATVVVLLLASAALEWGTGYARVFRSVELSRRSGIGLRARLEESLERTPERDLVIVRYGERHDVGAEWVYNRADIDAAPVVWAREMDAASNQRLLRHFRDRKTWLLLPDEHPIQLLPHPEGTGPISPAEDRSPGSEPPAPERR
jgi:hypothetical protein